MADEDPDYRAQVRATFSGLRQVLEAADAVTALACVAEHERDETFAVLLSMTLPQQGAFDVLAAIQANPALWHVPVLVTLPQDEALERQALRAGADDFIKKPHTQVGLRKRLELLTPAYPPTRHGSARCRTISAETI